MIKSATSAASPLTEANHKAQESWCEGAWCNKAQAWQAAMSPLPHERPGGALSVPQDGQAIGNRRKALAAESKRGGCTEEVL